MIIFPQRILLSVVVALGFGLYGLDVMAAFSKSQPPLRTVTACVDAEARTRFFDQLTKYAEHYGFAIRIAPNGPDGQHFTIQMFREDLKVKGTNSLDVGTFNLYFYNNGTQTPTVPQLDGLAKDLQRFVSEAKGVTLIVK